MFNKMSLVGLQQGRAHTQFSSQHPSLCRVAPCPAGLHIVTLSCPRPAGDRDMRLYVPAPEEVGEW